MIDTNFSKDVLLKVLSEFFCTSLSGKKKIQVPLHEPELRCLPYLYLVRFLVFCEKNLVSASSVRIFYFDSTCSMNENLIAIRFPEFKSSIFFFNAFYVPSSVPEIPKNDQVLTILMIDNPNFPRKLPLENCDIEIDLVSR